MIGKFAIYLGTFSVDSVSIGWVGAGGEFSLVANVSRE